MANTPTREHREAASDILPGAPGALNRIAQALADAEQRGAMDAVRYIRSVSPETMPELLACLLNIESGRHLAKGGE